MSHFFSLVDKLTTRMNYFLVVFISLFVAGVCSEASPYLSELQSFPLEIVNGTEAEEGEFPYLVQLISGSLFACSGAIIGEKWVLTAARCVESPIDMVVYGTNDLYFDLAPTDNRIKVKKLYQHPKFDMKGLPIYDVAIVELETSIPFDDRTKPLKVADSDNVPFHVPGVLAGWGLIKSVGDVEDRLQKIQLQLLNSLECVQAIGNITGLGVFNGTHHLCSDDYLNGQCYGDSGSPFVIDDLIYGVVSWFVDPCGSHPGAYSRITNPEYRSFIREIAGV